VLLASIIVYLLATVAIGFWASKRVRSSGDFLLAGRSLPLVLSSSALFATWFGSETVFGASSEFLRNGLYGVIEDPFGAALCLILFGLFFARKLYRMELMTLGDLFRKRYGHRTEILASLFMIPSYFGYIAAQLVAMGLILNVVTGIDPWVGMTVSAGVVTVYTFVGGMWAISITDFVQSVIIVLGLVVLAVVLSAKAGGVSAVLADVPAETFRFLPEPDGVSILNYIAAWSVIGLGSIPSQDVFQRAMSSGSKDIAVKSCYIGAGLYLTIAIIPLFISLCTRHLFPEQVSGDTQLSLPTMVLRFTSTPIQILFFGSLLSAIMSTTSSVLLAPAAIFSENVVKPLRRRPPSDRQLLQLTRMSILAFSVISTCMAMMKNNIYELVGESSIFSMVSLLVPMVAGLYWKRSTPVGAVASMIAGMVAWYLFAQVEMPVPAFLPATAVSALAMIAGSLATKPPSRISMEVRRGRPPSTRPGCLL
jgi:SSS family transporter